ncbi:hypothetical protein HGQ17_08025 [Nesterenkonia sp. MY13]|uniref:Uncharacterized protein n=1 Tax=Nesterenkonia sedimenti TaxID=1463632 RepID=A0A7X8TJY9_9MICC|nr:hypothetical protein [Nesterenkonia sedimenti]NLS09949.1 hypothetical protein [Nesterenkonia sedimenti]
MWSEWFHELSEEDLEEGVRDFNWSSHELTVRFGDLANYLMLDDLDGIEFDFYEAVDQAVSAGQPPEQVGALYGEFDAESLRSEFADLGWEGEEVLETELDFEGARLLSMYMPRVLTEEDRLLYGRQNADLESDTSATDDERIQEQLDCLGDVVAGAITGGIAVGVAPDDDDLPRGVICAEGDPEELSETIAQEVESGASWRNGRPYSEYFIDPEEDPHGELARVYVNFPEVGEDDARLPYNLFNLHFQQDLPGLVDEADAEFQDLMDDALDSPLGGEDNDDDAEDQ